jgi:hypothetical protein
MLESSAVVARRLRRWWPISFVLVLAACLSAPPRPSPSATPTNPPSPRAAPTRTPTAAGPAAPSAEERRRLQQQVIGLRGLDLTAPVAETILSLEGLHLRLAGDLLADEPPADEASLFSLLDLVDAATDLQSLYRSLYAEQVDAVYDSEGERMILAAGPIWTGGERLRYLHAFTHALQAQAFQPWTDRRISEAACRGADDRCRALAALVEGDAALIEEQWLRTYATPEDLADLARAAAAETSPVLDSAPSAIRDDWHFAQDRGLEYVRGLYLRDGWAAVDKAYAHPPQTTEEILHPGVTLRPPAIVDLGDLAAGVGEGWQVVGRGVVGEWLTRLMLSTRLDTPQAEAAAAGWGGDGYLVLHHEGDGSNALVLVTVWDRAFDAYEFVTAMVQHAEARFGPTTGAADGASWTWQDGRIRLVRAYLQTLWIIAPNSAEAEALLRSIRFPVST